LADLKRSYWLQALYTRTATASEEETTTMDRMEITLRPQLHALATSPPASTG
jgi:hypothetical protein